MKKEYCQRNFGKTQVTISYEGEICITDGWYTNWGCIYDHNISQFKNGIINPCTGYRVQVIGMDTQPSRTICNWIYSKIEKGYFDHLIAEGVY